MLPLALGIGSGAEILQPLAIAVIGGVTVSMLLSLLVTPTLFYLLREKWLYRRFTKDGDVALFE